jgi:uncharacterized membrane protein YedE/YeeE
MTLRGVLRHVLIVLASAVLAFVTGFILAFVTAPFWGWFEDKTGIESLGHSGPAEWVFWLLFGVSFVFYFALMEFAVHRKPAA